MPYNECMYFAIDKFKLFIFLHERDQDMDSIGFRKCVWGIHIVGSWIFLPPNWGKSDIVNERSTKKCDAMLCAAIHVGCPCRAARCLCPAVSCGEVSPSLWTGPGLNGTAYLRCLTIAMAMANDQMLFFSNPCIFIVRWFSFVFVIVARYLLKVMPRHPFDVPYDFLLVCSLVSNLSRSLRTKRDPVVCV